MGVTNEMLDAWFEELNHDNKSLERMWFWFGIAAYTHLSSPGSEKWRKEHGFLNND